MFRVLVVASVAGLFGALGFVPTGTQPPKDPPKEAPKDPPPKFVPPPAEFKRDTKPADAPLRGVDDELVNQVKKGIDKGVAYFRAKQAKDGSWESFVFGHVAGFKGGTTALAVLALLNCGLKHDDPAVAKGLDYLRALGTPDKTYVVALQTLALAEARQKKDLPQIAKNAEWLQKTALLDKNGRLKGWSYPLDGFPGGDNSNTQYALLGLYAAKTAGVEIPAAFWEKILTFYTRTQVGDGWGYVTGTEATFTMTVGGACGLIIAAMGLDKSQQGLDERTGVAANCGAYPENDALAKGLNWVATRFNLDEGKSMFYNYYGIERLGRLSGRRFIGRYDWYRQGCTNLVRFQAGDGSFPYPDRGQGIDGGNAIVTSAFALLFLSKGRTPVLVSKFAWGNWENPKEDVPRVLVEHDLNNKVTLKPDWNRKHNDARHMVEFAAREIFDNEPLAWQVYDPRLQGLTANESKIDTEVGLLLQSPVLYLNGHGRMPFVNRGGELLSLEEKILKRYLEEGGFIFAEACCGDVEFARSFEKLIDRIAPGGTLRKLPPEHSIWTMFPGISPADFPDLQYLDRGCRTVAVFSPSPLAGYWEESKYMPKNGRNPQNRGEKAFCLSRNVIAYATGMELPKPKLTRTILVAGTDAGIARSKFRPAQIRYISDASAQPPPAADALKNLTAYLQHHAKLDTSLTTEVLSPTDQALFKYKFMYLHGRKPVKFTDDELDNLKVNMQTKGVLLADAACNGFKQWQEFDRSFRAAVEKMWGKKLVPIEERADGKPDPFFKVAADAGIDIKNVKCRREKADGTGPEAEMRTYPVALEGIKVDGRWVVIYSKYDIGCAIEGHKSADCLGHDKDSALRIGSAAVLYSLTR
jgi:hypothetical protein